MVKALSPEHLSNKSINNKENTGEKLLVCNCFKMLNNVEQMKPGQNVKGRSPERSHGKFWRALTYTWLM
jgi:hypothetical protein